jgi:hypothetical protein
MGPRIMILPSVIVIKDYHQFIPTAINPPANIYVGTQSAIDTHNAAKL